MSDLRSRLARAFAAVGLLGTVAAGCAPGLSPVTRDYRLATSAPGTSDSLALVRAAAALGRAGWTLAPSPGGALTTTQRAGSDWLLYDMRLRLDVIPIEGGHLRIVFDPVRRYVWRSRTHVPYLPGGLARAFVPPLDAALKAEGLAPVATGAARDLGRRRANRVDG